MRIGSLFSGYGGLEQGVQQVLGGETAWVSDICRTPTKDNPATHYEPHRGACKILAHRYPDVPNLGDISTIDWASVEPVDVLTGGFPCQDVSHAGKRAGLRPDTRTGLWSQMAYAIDQLRPRLVVAENVRGLLSAAAHSDLEPCPWCVGDGEGEPSLRALGAVLGDLADIGYDASWFGLRAADVGAPHGRFRVFLVAYPEGDAGRIWDGDGGAAAVAPDLGHERPGPARDGRSGPKDGGLLPTPVTDPDSWNGHARDLGSEVRMLPTPTTRDDKGRNQRDDATCLTGALMPTPRAADGTKGGPNQRGSSGDLMLPSAVALLPTPAAQEPGGTVEQYHARLKAADGRDSTFTPLSMLVQLLPTPTSTDHKASGASYPSTATHSQGTTLTDATVRQPHQWGDYADAIARWEHLTRPAPAPTMTSTKGNPQLAPTFVEWLMGLPAGWVTDVPGITRNEALKALGNGVVPQQAAAALRQLLDALVPA